MAIRRHICLPIRELSVNAKSRGLPFYAAVIRAKVARFASSGSVRQSWQTSDHFRAYQICVWFFSIPDPC
jgi:hypothetical protein